jgi:hypothetical protein
MNGRNTMRLTIILFLALALSVGAAQDKGNAYGAGLNAISNALIYIEATSPEAPTSAVFDFTAHPRYSDLVGNFEACVCNPSTTVDLLARWVPRSETPVAAVLTAPAAGVGGEVVRIRPSGSGHPMAGMVCVEGTWSGIQYQAATTSADVVIMGRQ